MKISKPLLLALSLLFSIASCSINTDSSIKTDEIALEEIERKNLSDDKSNTDEITYQKLNKYLSDRNLELCSFYDQIEKMEIDCIHKADAMYPDFGIKHNEYVEKLTATEIKELGQKHNIADSVFTLIAILGVSYCK
ncbi:hypothetical protein [Fluviicola sp.]|uniref:hypothetical protein n=1 Tax=Fluviicola sp. TaxID=1917219 RepID=UPI003D2B7920